MASAGSSTGGLTDPTLPSTSTSSVIPSQTWNVNDGPDDGLGGSGLATSASLYLYTFLATLVVLLLISGGIILRSFYIRRRHRREIEEAIRNGTWVPPSPNTPPNATRVDLSMKPKLWEVYVGGYHAEKPIIAGQTIGSRWKEDHSVDWDIIKPFSAAYYAESDGQDQDERPVSPPPPVADVPPASMPTRPLNTLVRVFRREDTQTASDSGFQMTALGTAVTDPPSAAGTDIASSAGSGESVPSTVRVALLIAMPSPHSPSPSSSASSSTRASSVVSRSPSDTTLTDLQYHPRRVTSNIYEPSEDEHSLPTLELGLALVPLAPFPRLHAPQRVGTF